MDKHFSYNKTKIVATVGPSSQEKETLRELIRTGVDVFRLNFSHGSHDDHLRNIQAIRSLNQELGTHIAILQDLQGPKIRVGEIKDGSIELKVGELLTITTQKIEGNTEKVSTDYTLLPQDVEQGDPILIDDGNLELRVISKTNEEVRAEVVHGGKLKSRKGINLPTAYVSAPSLTEKDIEDLEFGLKNDVDWIALSFVRSADDIKELKKRISQTSCAAKVIAKIEKPQAVDNIDEIIRETDAIMVARGDLGVEIPMESVPLIQKDVIKKCNINARPAIVATQMLESMIHNPRPTRAEASDVANAIMDGADAIMLSAETAAGNYPALSVKSMVKIAHAIEENVIKVYHRNYNLDQTSETYNNDRVLASAATLAKDTCARAITGISFTGYTAFGLSRFRPIADIFIFTENKKLLNQINLIWGVRGYYYTGFESTDDVIEGIKSILAESGFIHKGDVMVNTGTLPVSTRERTNTVRLTTVD